MSMQHPPLQDQHFIPESFLKEFINNEGKFFQYHLKYKDIRWKYPSEVCKQTNFYDITEPTVLNRYQIDFRHIENSFHYENILTKSILPQLKARKMLLTNKDCQTIVEAYISIKYRTPYMRKAVHAPKIKENSINSALATVRKRNATLFKVVEDYYDFESHAKKLKEEFLKDTELPRKMHITGLVEASFRQNIPVNDAILKIQSMNIYVAEAGADDYFFISDNPGFSFDGKFALNTNFGNFSQILFPINSKQLIMFNDFDNRNYVNPIHRVNYFPVNARFVQQVNQITMNVADEKVFCADKTYLENFKMR